MFKGLGWEAVGFYWGVHFMVCAIDAEVHLRGTIPLDLEHEVANVTTVIAVMHDHVLKYLTFCHMTRFAIYVKK